MVGSTIKKILEKKGYTNIISIDKKDLDLRNQTDVQSFFKKNKPDYVILAAAKVGGIMANNKFRAEFIYDNLQIQNNIIHQSYLNNVKKLLFLGSSCIYPKESKQPIKEEYLLNGKLEYTNEPYAISKIAGIKLCESYYKQYNCDFISVMPTNLFGENDNFDFETSHVLPALMRKLHLGKCLMNNDWAMIYKDLKKYPIKTLNEYNHNQILKSFEKIGILYDPQKNITTIKLWGSGKVYREFLHVEDLANACLHIMKNVDANYLYETLGQTHINIGTGQDLTIQNLVDIIKKIVNYKGKISWDNLNPDGTKRKKLDIQLLNSLNWKYKIPLEQGIHSVYKKYINYN